MTKIIQYQIELVPKTDKMDNYLSKLKGGISASGGAVTGGGKSQVESIEKGTTNSLKNMKGTFVSSLVGGFVGGFMGSAFFQLLDGISEGFKVVLQMIKLIAQLLGLIVMPFANLLIPLLIPLIYLLTPLIKVLNLLLTPVLIKLLEFFGEVGDDAEEEPDIQKAGGFFQLFLNSFGKVLEGLAEGEGIEDSPMEKLKTSFSYFVESFLSLIDYLILFASIQFGIILLSLAGFFTLFNIIFGEGDLRDKIKAIGQLIIDLITALKNFFMLLIFKFIDFIFYFIAGIVNLISPEWAKAVLKFKDELKEMIGKYMEFSVEVASKLIETLTDIAVALVDLFDSIKELIKGKFGEMKVIMVQLIKDIKKIADDIIAEAKRKVTSIVNSAKEKIEGALSLVGLGGKKTEEGGDFILKPNGELLKFSPYDTIMGFRNDGGGVGGLVNNNTSNRGGDIIININGTVTDEEIIKKIKNALERENRNDLTKRGVGLGVF